MVIRAGTDAGVQRNHPNAAGGAASRNGRWVAVIRTGEAVMLEAEQRVRYAAPRGPAEYIAICLPAFSPETVNRAAVGIGPGPEREDTAR